MSFLINPYRYVTAAGGSASHRAIASTTYATRTNTSVNKPTGTVDGDILIMMFVIGGSGTPPTPTYPAGWTTLQGPTRQTDSFNYSVDRTLLCKQASSEGSSYSITHNSGASEAVIVAVQGGALGSSPVVVSSSNGNAGKTTTATGITTRTANAWVGFLVHNWDLYGAASPPTGTTPTFTERLDASTSLIYVADGTLAAAGATGDKTHTNGNSQDTYPWGAFLVSVNAA